MALGDITPHAYSPDYQAMGDCRICGHTRADCDRIQATLAERERKKAQQEYGPTEDQR